MTRTPRTEDAWRDATMAPRYTAEAEAAKWKRVAHAMYDFAQALEQEKDTPRLLREIEAMKKDLWAAEHELADQEDELDRLRDLLKDAEGE